MAVIDELVTVLGLDVDPAAEGEASRFQDTISGVRTTVLAAGAALVTLLGATGAASKGFAEATDSAKKFTDSLDFDFEAFQELAFAVQRSGGSVDGLKGDIETLTKTFGNGERALERLVLQFDSLSNVQAQQLGDSLGLSQDTVLLLQQGSDGIEDLRVQARQLGGIIPPDLADRTADFNDELTNLAGITSGINNTLQAALIPAFTEATRALRVFLVENRRAIESGLGVFIEGVREGFSQFEEVVRAVTGTLAQFLGPVFQLGEGLDAAGLIGNTVTAVLVALAAILTPIAIKIALIAAAVATVVIVVDDLITFLQGGESAIGAFFDAFENRFPALFDLLSTAADTFKSFFGLVIDGWAAIGEGLLSILPDIGSFVESIGDALEAGARLLGFGGNDTAAALPSAAPASASVISNTANQRGGDVNQTFNINGAGDPRAVGGEVARRSNLGAVTQTLAPGQRAPRIA